MRRFPLAAAILVTLLAPYFSRAEKAPTNFVFFLVDDLGWADLSCYGSTFHETPNIDALADSGMKFTNGYAAASICSPTRASILTGRHPVRVDVTDWIPGQKLPENGTQKFLHVEDRDNLALEETTIAEALKAKGYATFFAGKWHLGDKGYWPDDQGFDHNIGGHDRGSPPGGYYSPWNNPALKSKGKGEYLTERLTEESIAFLKEREKEQPFLLYLSYYNVHSPIQPYKKRIDHFLEKAEKTFTGETPTIPEHDVVSRGRQDNPEFASMVAAVDDSVGAVLKAVDDLDLSDDTVVIFFSDNVCDTPVMSTDFFPTMLDLAGLPLMPETHPDGISLLPLLKGNASSKESRPLVWHYPHYHGSGWTPGAAIREGDLKLIEFWEHDKVELYDLSTDIGEQNDLSKEQPETVSRLQTQLAEWQKTIGAKMPKLNPGYSPKN